MKYTRRGSALTAVLVAALSGCGDSDNGITGHSEDLTGTWGVAVTVTGGVQLPPGTQLAAVLTLVQTGATATGTFVMVGVSGTVNGTLSGQDFTFTLTQAPSCSGTFDGTGTVNTAVTRLEGSYSGSDCNGTLAADFVATKQ